QNQDGIPKMMLPFSPDEEASQCKTVFWAKSLILSAVPRSTHTITPAVIQSFLCDQASHRRAAISLMMIMAPCYLPGLRRGRPRSHFPLLIATSTYHALCVP